MERSNKVTGEECNLMHHFVNEETTYWLGTPSPIGYMTENLSCMLYVCLTGIQTGKR
jgi:hypothetical protein